MKGESTRRTAATATLPMFDEQVQRIAAAERGDGWLASCIDAGCYLALNREFVAALAECLSAIDARPRVEVCAGGGELAEALTHRGVCITATDADPTVGSPVLRASADEALRQYRPGVVLGCFVPIDARVDEAVLACPSVRHYVVLGACVGGEFGSARLWRAAGWTCRYLSELSRWMLTRHDLWTGERLRPMVQQGVVWCFTRQGNTDSSTPRENAR